MTYRAPVADIAFAMNHVAGLEQAISSGIFKDLSSDVVSSILEEAGRFANEAIAPLNRIGDREGARQIDGKVVTAPGWKETYRAWSEAGWGSLTGPAEYGGQELPFLLACSCYEMWSSASMAFCLGPILTTGAVEALNSHGSKDLKDRYLAKLISGEWMATMNLTESEAGSDLAAIKARAFRHQDGTYRIKGQKIFITYGDHDLTDNIIHMVLARLPDAPAGTKGISLFLVPKALPDGSRNDVVCASLEHKLGIHGSPTCVMEYGANDGAVGWLVGEENRGLACMFTMMNNARLAVGIEGVSIAERAFQQGLAYAGERRQGRSAVAKGDGMSPIIAHPDVKRMLLTMKALTQAARGICYMTAAAIDQSTFSPDGETKEMAMAQAALLTPIAKAFSTDIGIEVASLNIQVHGGAGYIEETGAAQHLRDARIAAIYEGTNGIQAIDLVMRKLPLAHGGVARAQIATIRKTAQHVAKRNLQELGHTGARLREAVESLDRATAFLLKAVAADPETALAVATPYLRLFAIVQGGGVLAETALSASDAITAGDNDPAHAGRIALCRFYAENLLPDATGLGDAVIYGADSVNLGAAALAE